MARTEEVTLLKDSSTMMSFNGNPLYLAFELLEVTMKDKKKKYSDKVASLLSVLGSVVGERFSGLTAKQTVFVFHFFRKHILSLVFHGDWLNNYAIQQHMSTILKRFELISTKKNLPSVAVGIRYLLELIKHPWGQTVKRILAQEHCTEEEILNLTKSEIDNVLNVRLEIMIAARCNCQALLLVERCLQCINKPEHHQLFLSFSDKITTIKDIYLVLLVKVKNNVKLSNEVAKLSLVEGFNLVCRCTNEDYLKCMKKGLLKMVGVVANMVLFCAMIHPISNEVSLQNLIEKWFNLYAGTHGGLVLLKNMSLCAVTSHHIYLLASTLVKKYGTLHKSLCIEMFIRAFTVNLNEMENHKSNHDHENIRQTEVQLSTGFLSLADYLKEDIVASRECVLTSYSLDPTSSCFERIRELAIACGKLKPPVNDCHDPNNRKTNRPTYSLKCQKNQCVVQDDVKETHSEDNQCNKIDQHELNPLKNNTNNDINVLIDSTRSNRPMCCKCKLTSSNTVIPDDFPNSDYIFNADKLGIPQTLCDDLLTVIYSARYNLLNWNLDWEELSSRCELYKISGKRLRSSEKELKYLKVDYNKFNDLASRPIRETNNSSIESYFRNYTEECLNDEEYAINIPAVIEDDDAHSQFSSETNNYELSNVILVYKCKDNNK